MADNKNIGYLISACYYYFFEIFQFRRHAIFPFPEATQTDKQERGKYCIHLLIKYLHEKHGKTTVRPKIKMTFIPEADPL